MRATLFSFVLLTLPLVGCGGGATPASDDAASVIDARASDASTDATGARDAGSDAVTAVDVGVDAFVAVDAAPDFNPACIATAIHSAADASASIPTSSGSSGSTQYTICPNGANASANPTICTEEMRLGSSALTPSVSATQVTLTGTMPFRVEDTQVQVNLGVCSPTIDFATNGDAACPGGTFDMLPVSIAIAIAASEGHSLAVQMVIDDAAVSANLLSNTQQCGGGACTGATCCVTSPCGCAVGGMNWTPVRTAVISSMTTVLRTSLAAQIEAQICAMGTCPSGTTADAAGICRYASGHCAPGPALFRSGC